MWKKLSISEKIGYGLLIPPSFSVLLFLIDYFAFLAFELGALGYYPFFDDGEVIAWSWVGYPEFNSALYLGLMAVAGAYLIKPINSQDSYLLNANSKETVDTKRSENDVN